MKITLSCLTLLVVFFITGIGDAQVTAGRFPADRTAHQIDESCTGLRHVIDPESTCIEMPGNEVDEVLHKMTSEEEPTAKVTYNDCTSLYEIVVSS